MAYQKEYTIIGLETTVCKSCSTTVERENMKKHMKEWHPNERPECKLCYKTFASVSNLTQHKTLRHLDDKEFLDIVITEDMLKYPCTACDKKFVKESLLDTHIKIHQVTETNNSNKCKLCYKKYRAKEMERHIRFAHKHDTEYLGREIEKSELKYPCNICPKVFIKDSILKKHKTEHELSKYEYLRMESSKRTPSTKCYSYKCKLCYRRFNRFAILVNHIVVNHEADKDLLETKFTKEDCTFACPSCDLVFISENSRLHHTDKKHQNLSKQYQSPHEDLKKVKDGPKQCKLCYKTCASSYGLKCHENIIHH